MHIGTRTIATLSSDEPPYIIAELGVNHDGSIERALALVDAAKAAGADAVKLQYFEARRLMSGASRLAVYQEGAGEVDPIAMLARLELSSDDLARIAQRARALGLGAIVTVFSTELVGAAETMGWDAYKTASPDIIHRPLLSRLVQTGRPLIISTGAATLHEVERALGWLEPARSRLALLQCVSSYPTPIAESALGAMAALRAVFPGPVGYSDHTPDTITGAIAVAAGGVILEKHLTYDRSAQGPDHAASLDTVGFTEYAQLARVAWVSTRDIRKRVLEREHDVRSVSRQSIVAARSIPRGRVIEPADLTIKRPGTGLEPVRLSEVLGRQAERDIEADRPLTPEDVRLVPAAASLPPGVRRRRTVAVVTGTRAEFGLLAPVMRAIAANEHLGLRVVAAGAHFLPPAETIGEVRAAFEVAATVPMQEPGLAGRGSDALALGRGVTGFAGAFATLEPDWVLVLGDRIEAFAAASAASVAGFAVAHIHGGDRAEGVADEAMRHAITKLAHMHLCATAESARRVLAMGEDAWRTFVVGSPAIDGLEGIPSMSDKDADAIGDPGAVVLLHPSGLDPERERAIVRATLDGVESIVRGGHVLMLAPNFDVGREVILDELRRRTADGWLLIEHLERERFIALLKRLAARERGVLVGNSSAALIEAAALGLRTVNVGPRQSGRERCDNVIDVREDALGELAPRFEAALALGPPARGHPYGDGQTAERIAALLAGDTVVGGLPAPDPADARALRKRNRY